MEGNAIEDATDRAIDMVGTDNAMIAGNVMRISLGAQIGNLATGATKIDANNVKT